MGHNGSPYDYIIHVALIGRSHASLITRFQSPLMQCLPTTPMIGRARATLYMQIEQPYGLSAWCAPSGSPLDGGLMRFILDEPRQKEMVVHHFLSTHSALVAHAQTVQVFISLNCM